MNILFVIPARGGSKGVPDKNIRLLGGKPLIQYTLEAAKTVAHVENICVSTDSEEIKNIVDFKFEYFSLENYQFHPAIKAPVAV